MHTAKAKLNMPALRSPSKSPAAASAAARSEPESYKGQTPSVCTAPALSPPASANKPSAVGPAAAAGTQAAGSEGAAGVAIGSKGMGPNVGLLAPPCAEPKATNRCGISGNPGCGAAAGGASPKSTPLPAAFPPAPPTAPAHAPRPGDDALPAPSPPTSQSSAVSSITAEAPLATATLIPSDHPLTRCHLSREYTSAPSGTQPSSEGAKQASLAPQPPSSEQAKQAPLAPQASLAPQPPSGPPPWLRFPSRPTPATPDVQHR